jgi:hypothetical protein
VKRTPWWTWFTLFAACSAGFAYLSTRPTTSQATVDERLSFDRTEYDFGTLGQMEARVASFQLTNQFLKPVELLEPQTGCSCQTATIEKKNLAPGESTIVKVAWNSAQSRGRVRHPIFLAGRLTIARGTQIQLPSAFEEPLKLSRRMPCT